MSVSVNFVEKIVVSVPTSGSVSVRVQPAASAVIKTAPGIPGPPGKSSTRSVFMTISRSAPGSNPLTDGTSKGILRIPDEMSGYKLAQVGACVASASSSGPVEIQVRRVRTGVADAIMLSTNITIDELETDSTTAAVSAVIDSGANEVDPADQIHIDVMQSGTGVLGAGVSLTFEPI